MRSLTLVLAIAACGCGGAPAASEIDAPTADAGPPCVPPAGSAAPTYTQLYKQFFARGATHGHCANAGCHSDPGHNEWICGPDKNTCYAGMVSIGLIDTTHGDRSMIGNPDISPLSWISPSGNMPFDAVGPFPEGRDAILAWVAACAQNN